MYHEVTNRDKARRRRRLAMLLVALAVVAVTAGVMLGQMRTSMREQGAAALRKSILDAAVRCCAVEGSYPLTLEHLEEDYGLRINHEDYVITYEAFASNIPPSVVVVPR